MVQDIDLVNGMVVLTTTKNRKAQYNPICQQLVKILTEYIRMYCLDKDDYLFLNELGEKTTRNSLQHAVARYNKSRGVNKTSIHAFRHTFAKHYITSDGDAFKLQRLLGHSTLAVTLNYVNLYSQDLKDGYDNHEAEKKMIGKRFGKLVVTRISDRKELGKTFFWCKCDCPALTEKEIRRDKLLKGQVKSCGCSMIEHLRETNIIDMTGLKFGRLTVIKKTEGQPEKGVVIWDCQCECDGNIKSYNGNDLRKGHTKSCGCIIRERTGSNSPSQWLHFDIYYNLKMVIYTFYYIQNHHIQEPRYPRYIIIPVKM
jgi:hypothetical protein